MLGSNRRGCCPPPAPSRSREYRLTLLPAQHARRYATESGAKPGSNTFLYLAGGAALAGAGYYYFAGTPAVQQAEAKVKQATGAAPKPAFTGGDQGFVSLKLADVENVNHNTKRFRFELPEGDMVSGLHIASAILTKYKGPNDEKATLRPYTPISDESRFLYLLLGLKACADTGGQVPKATLTSS